MNTVYAYSTELMSNYRQATVMAPELAFQAVQTNAGLALLFAVGSDGGLYVVTEQPGTVTGWQKIALTSSLPGVAPGASVRIKSFAVAQAQATGLIDLAVTVAGKSSDALYLCLGNSAGNTAWLAAPKWVAAPYDDVGHPAPSGPTIQNVFIGAASDAQYLVADVLRDPSSPEPQIFRYFIDPTKALTGQIWNACDVPADIAAAREKTCLGRRVGDSVDGFYTLGATGGNTLIFQPLYNLFNPKISPSPARLVLPTGATATALATAAASGDATDLFVAAGQELYYFPADGQQDLANAIRLLSVPLLAETRALFCFGTADSITLLSLNRANQLVRMHCATTDLKNPTAWGPPIPIYAGVQQASPYCNRADTANTVFLEIGGDQLRRATQSPETSVWRFDTILQPPLETTKAQPGNSYTTRIQVSDQAQQPLAATPVQLSALSRAGVSINGTYYVLDQQPVPVTTDAVGCLVIVEWTGGMNATPLRICGADGTVIAINPMEKPFKKIATLNTPDALSDAMITNADGSKTSLVPPGQSHDDLAAVAGAMGALGDVYQTLPADGSVARAPHLAAVAGVAASRFEIVASVAVGMPQHLTALAAVRPMGVGDTIVTAAGDLLDWLKSTASYVIHIVKDTASGVWHFVASIGGKLYSFVFDTIAKVVASVESIFNAIKTAIEDIIRFLRFLFEGKDFLRTRDVVKKLVLFSLDVALDGLSTLKTDFDGLITDAKTKVDNWAAIKQDSWEPSVPNSGSGLNYLQTIMDVGKVVTAPAMFLYDHLVPNVGGASGGTMGTVPLAQSILARALAVVEDQGGLLVSAVGRIQSELLDGSAYASMSLLQVLEKLTAIVVDAFLNSGQTVVDALIDVLAMLGKSAIQALDTPIRIPVLSDILADVFGVDLSFSVLDAIVMAAAVPATIGYKLLMGAAPFPADDPFANAVLQAQTLQDLARRLSPPHAQAILAANDGGAPTVASWVPIQVSPAAQKTAFLVGHLVAGIGGMIATVVTVPSMLQDDAMGEQYELASTVCGVVSGFSAALATVLSAPCPIQNPHMARLASAAGALTVLGKVSFGAAPWLFGGNAPSPTLGATCKKLGSGFDALIALIGMVSTCYHFYELSQTPASRERTEAIFDETSTLSTALSRCATFAARMDQEPVSKGILVAVMSALTFVASGFQIAESIAAATEPSLVAAPAV